MATLNDFPKIAKSLNTGSTSKIKLLHRLIFDSDGDRQNRARLRKFTGFPPDFDLEEAKQKVIKKFLLKDLISICNILHLEFSTELETCAITILHALSDFNLLDTSDLISEMSDEGDNRKSEQLVTTHTNASIPSLNNKPHPESQVLADISQNSIPLIKENHSLGINNASNAETDVHYQNHNTTILNNSVHSFSSLEAKQQNTPCLTFGLKDIVDLIKPFSSKDNYSIEAFISDIEDIFDLYQITNPVSQVLFVKKCLTGPALTLIRSIRGITNWEQMRKHLLEEFSDKINGLQLHNMMQARRLKSFETLQEYFLAMRDLGHKGSLDDSSLFDYVINGIPDSSNNKIMLYGCKTILEFKEKLKIYEKIFNASKHSNRKFDTPPRDAKFEQKQVTQPTCYTCGLKGHKSTFCKNKERGKKCYGCQNFGHVHANCPRNRSNSATKPNQQPSNSSDRTVHQISQLSEQFPTNIMHVPVTLAKTQFIALCDTGSQATIINEKTYRSIGSPPLYPSQVTFAGIGRDKVKGIGFFQDSITMQDITLSTNIHVVNNNVIPLDVIVGMDCLRQTEFTFGKNGINVCKHSAEMNAAMCENLVVDRIFPPACLESLEEQSRDTCESGSVSTHENFLCFISASAVSGGEENEANLTHIVDKELRNSVSVLIRDYQPQKNPRSSELKMNIIINDEIPVSQRSRRIPFPEQKIVEKQIDEWLRDGIIKPSCSEYASPIVLCKKRDGTSRLCVDFRLLNRKVVKDSFPMVQVEEVLDHLGDAKVFSTLDLKNGFFHVPVEERCTKYLAFTSHVGLFEFLKAPFGLCTSPSVFQRFIHNIFRDLVRENIVIIYMDDFIIPARTEEEGLEKLKRVLARAKEYGLEINFKKCQFLKRKIEFLGYVIEGGTIRPSPEKTIAVQNFPEPKNIKQIQSFLGLTGYFRKFIENYSKIAKPLSDLLRNETEFRFGVEQKQAFEALKQSLTNDPVLHIFRQGAKLELHTDASSHGFGAILFQEDDDGKMYPIQYMSKKTTPQQEKYHSYELEVLAIIEALKKFRNYLLGTKFKIITDCDAFQKTMHKNDLPPKIARWALMLEEFHYEVCHRPGKQMKHVDALSRYPVLLISSNDVTQKVKDAQDQDDFISQIKNMLTSTPVDDYFLKNGILYKLHKDKELLVIPQLMQSEIIKNAHSQGHFSCQKTELIVSRDYYIPHLKKLVQEVISNCIPCILSSRKSGKQEGLLHPIPKGDKPLDCYHCDFLGPLPSTKKCYKYIFTVIDAFSKFVWIYPVKSPSSKDALEKLTLQQTTFGNPSKIITDKGSSFTSTEFQTYCQEQSIDHIQITTGIPRGNGQVERIHGTIIPVLTKLAVDEPDKWFKYVPRLQRILNSTTTRSTKYTPFQLLIGINMKQKEDLEIKQLLEEEHYQTVIHVKETLRDEAKQNILKLQEENRRQYNKRRKPACKYKLGDKVAIQRTQFGTGLKLRPRYFGPYEVTKINPNDRYEVRKLGLHEGPNLTSTAADKMKNWCTN
jgi:ribonuclease HI